MTLGAVLQKARERRRGRPAKTQAEVAAEIGCSQAAVSYWESDEEPPHASRWQAIADAYGLKLDLIVKLIAKRLAA